MASKVISEQKTFFPSNAPCPTFGIPYASIPANFIARCNDAVPADNATACLHPIYSHAILSTSLIFFPTVDIQFVSYASFTYSISGPCIVGLLNQTFDSNFSKLLFSLNICNYLFYIVPCCGYSLCNLFVYLFWCLKCWYNTSESFFCNQIITCITGISKNFDFFINLFFI